MRWLFRNARWMLAILVGALWTPSAVQAKGSPWLADAGQVAAVQTETKDKSATPEAQLQAIFKEFNNTAFTYYRATNSEERQTLVDRADKLTSSLMELAGQHPKEPVALEALTQVVSHEYWLDAYTSHPGQGKDSRQAKAITLLQRDFLLSDKLGETCKRVHFGFRKECETFLRTVLEKSPHREIRAAACLHLAQFLASRLDKLDLLANQPDLTKRYEGLYGADYLATLRRQDRVEVLSEAETLYEYADENYGNVTLPYCGKISDQVKLDLFDLRYLTIGKAAPDFEGRDQDGQSLKLSSHRGKVVLLYFWSEY